MESTKSAVYSFGKLIIVSNRLPFVLTKNEQTQKWERKASAGGLVTAVAPVVVKKDGLWIGWAGVNLKNGEQIPESDPNDTTPTAGLRSNQVIPLAFDCQTFDSYYDGCCNGTFWPLFHSMPDKTQFSAKSWKSYCAVNKEFASKTINTLENLSREEMNSGIPLVWLHDYHLMLAANYIRKEANQKSLKFKLGFFLHIPFPSWDIFRLFPWSEDILNGMLGCDMIGFHIIDYCTNFIDCCHRRLNCRVDRENLNVEHEGRLVRISTLPIGIPFDRFVEMAKKSAKVLSTSLKLILGVDRLDYTKGLVHRLKSFELLLEQYPQHRSKVVFLQIAVPSRTNVKEYKVLKEEIDQLVGCINGRFSTPNWSPIKYIYGCVSQNELASFYRDSAVAMVTPLRDGMNLVAKEFVACQTKEPPGVLILSPFAGAGEFMSEALFCNPYELDYVANTLHRALTMPEGEKILRMKSLRYKETLFDVHYWMKSFLKTMGTLIDEDNKIEPSPTIKKPITVQELDDYLFEYIGNTKELALLLDYDGTLAPLASHPDLATIPTETKNILERLANIPGIYISIISGRNVDNVKNMVGIKGLTYAGNHGLEILYSDGRQFVYPMPKEYEHKSIALLMLLQEHVCKHGAWVENKGVVLTFHYRKVPVEARSELKIIAQRIIEEAGFIVGQAHCAIEAKPPVSWNKGLASLHILRSSFGLNWYENIKTIYAGDDVTDEDAMVALKGMAATFRITQSHIVKTSAQTCLHSTESILHMLKSIENYFHKDLLVDVRGENEQNHLQGVPLGEM